MKISTEDRDRHFQRKWGEVLLEIDGEPQPVACNIDKDSFWTPTCRELINAGIGRWLKKTRLAPWEEGCPPKLNLIPVAGNLFRLQYEREVQNAA